MKLAEALLRKKHLKERLNDLGNRFSECAMIEEGTEPDVNPELILAETQNCLDELEKLTVNINTTNNNVMVGQFAMTMMQALAHRDSLKNKINKFHEMSYSVRYKSRKTLEFGPKMVLAQGVSTKYFVRVNDELSKELRLLDTAIQAANWEHTLQEEA